MSADEIEVKEEGEAQEPVAPVEGEEAAEVEAPAPAEEEETPSVEEQPEA